METLYLIYLIIFIIGLILFLISITVKSKYHFKLKEKNAANFAILIPAKDESKVITELLESIKNQIDNMNRVYVIVESLDDKTCSITKKYSGNVILRTDLTKKRKGFALDEAVKEILKAKKYDLYFILDADNILNNNFINELLITYKKGYDIGVGYRNIKNGNNKISACSGLTFSMVNSFNKFKNKVKQVVAISGTGFYITGDVINKEKGFPFNSLTEDYELSLYATANNLSTYYNEKAMFYDEKPTSFKATIKQRTRWVKGFFEARKKRLKEIKNDNSIKLGLTPYLFIVSGLLLFLFTNIFMTIYYIITSNNYIITLTYAIATILFIYLVFLLATITIIIIDKRVNLNIKLKIKSIFFNPIFLTSYVICFFKAITKKDIKWEKIEHKEQLKKY